MPRNDQLPELRLEVVAISELRGLKNQIRKKSAEHIAEVARSIQRHGFSDRVLIDRDRKVIDGAIAIAAAEQLGLKEVPCLVADHLTPEQARTLRIAINRLSEKGEWDLDQLKIEVLELIELDIPVLDLGFGLPEIDIITGDAANDDDDGADDDPDPDDGPPVSQVGDVWLLGKHRLICGNSLEPETYDRLMKGEKATAAFLDAPFDIPLAGFVTSNAKDKGFAMGTGELGDKFIDFLADSHAHVAGSLVDGGVLYSCMDHRHIDILMAAVRQVGLKINNLVVWNKAVGGQGGSIYRSQHELIIVAVKGDKPAINNVGMGRHGRDRTNVWTVPGANRKGSSANDMLGRHATPKPVELVADALLDVTRRGDVVIDVFMGSGTTIIAAEKTGRIARGIELMPAYVDLAVRRFMKFTNKEATHEATGLTFEALAAQRRQEAAEPGQAD